MKRLTIVISRILNPRSGTSVWENRNFTLIVIRFIAIISVLITLNISGIIAYKLDSYTSNYNYDFNSGCTNNYTSTNSIFDLKCYDNDGKFIHGRLMCGNPIYIIDFLVCTVIGIPPLAVIVAIIYVVIQIPFILYSVITSTKDVFAKSYQDSIAHDIV